MRRGTAGLLGPHHIEPLRKEKRALLTFQRIILLGLVQASAVTLYIVLFGLVVTSFSTFEDESNEFLAILTGLLLFVTSACITGASVLAYPTVLAFRKQFREAGLLVAASVFWLGVALVTTWSLRWFMVNFT